MNVPNEDVRQITSITLQSESDVIEELRVYNDELRKQVKHLLDELKVKDAMIQKLQDSNEKLREAFDKQRGKTTTLDSNDDVEPSPAVLNMDLNNLSSLDLPPLEVPKFDFDSLCLKDDI